MMIDSTVSPASIKRRTLRIGVALGAALLLAWCFRAWLDPSVLLGLMSGLSFCG